jgi:hypothetical protein
MVENDPGGIPPGLMLGNPGRLPEKYKEVV